ncbi:MAG: DUF3786 domain-containing protein [Desulfobacteraceae bacterium]|nr:MAG: DUF3786 domain-containing protein [Desulfobacteraceae bacterium]
MARIDDFQQARDLAAGELSQEDLQAIAARSGFALTGSTVLRAPFLNRVYRIASPDFTFSDEDDPSAQVPLHEQVLILHYLKGCRPLLKSRWVAYRELPGAGFYFGAFIKRAIEPLKKAFGRNVQALKTAGARLGALPIGTGDAGLHFDLLPYAPIQIILWQGDDEFPAEANILYDASAGEYFSPEDAAWLASLTVYRLMALAR